MKTVQQQKKLTRRHFLVSSSAAASGLILTGCAFQQSAGKSKPRRISPNEKLNIGIIGAGGKGLENIAGVSSENIIAVCDVDDNRAAEAFKRLPGAQRYRDYRKMLEKSLDAVVVTTPDHHHAPAAIMAMKLGMHVYCEKPLTHSIYEARLMREVAKRQKVATQMGNQGHSYNETRRVVELIRAGVLGKVREVHVWTDRPIWPQGMPRPTEAESPPSSLDWDLWLGPAPKRPYHSSYLPFNWRGWWDFGTGALGDMGCHNMDAAFWALDLNYPDTVEAESSGVNSETAPKWSVIQYQFPARRRMPPVRVIWYDGGKLPQIDDLPKPPKNGCVIIGDKGKMVFDDWHPKNFRLLPEEDFRDFKGPDPSLPRSKGHYLEWIEACKGGPPALSSFDYAARLTETMLLGNLALRVGRKIEWDAKQMKARSCPEAEQFIRRSYRQGWSL